MRETEALAPQRLLTGTYAQASPPITESSWRALEVYIQAHKPCVIRQDSALAHADLRQAVASFLDEHTRLSITVEHKHRWRNDRKTMPLSSYLSALEFSDYYWRQVEIRSLSPKMRIGVPLPCVRADVNYFDFLWIGPTDTIQTFHQDNHNDAVVNQNLFVQVHGYKYVAVAGHVHSDVFRAHPLTEGNARHSQLDPFVDDLYRICPSLCHAILREGDALYIPPGWWHYVRSLSVSISLSRWWFENPIAEILYIAGREAPESYYPLPPRPKGSWPSDLLALGGPLILHDVLRRLPPVKQYAIVLALRNSYAEEVLK